MFNLYIPQRAFFNYSFVCPYRLQAPPINGNLRDWDDNYLIPDLMRQEGADPFAQLYMAWNETGLYFGLQVKGKSHYKLDPQKYWQGDCLELWLDTRDVKDTHRANRYCYHFYFLPGGSGKNGHQPIGRQTTIDNAREQAPPFPEESIHLGLRRLKRSYQMEIALDATQLHGFQPDEFDRLGFNYVLHDTEKGTQSWTASRDQERAHDPSAWGSVEITRS